MSPCLGHCIGTSSGQQAAHNSPAGGGSTRPLVGRRCAETDRLLVQAGTSGCLKPRKESYRQVPPGPSTGLVHVLAGTFGILGRVTGPGSALAGTGIRPACRPRAPSTPITAESPGCPQAARRAARGALRAVGRGKGLVCGPPGSARPRYQSPSLRAGPKRCFSLCFRSVFRFALPVLLYLSAKTKNKKDPENQQNNV